MITLTPLQALQNLTEELNQKRYMSIHMSRALRVIQIENNPKSPYVQIKCIETGEIFENATQTTIAHNLTYSALLQHLKGKKGYKSVKGKTYEKVYRL